MTADDVTMDVSLLYTYRVSRPGTYQLEVLDPELIVAGFVQGTLQGRGQYPQDGRGDAQPGADQRGSDAQS